MKYCTEEVSCISAELKVGGLGARPRRSGYKKIKNLLLVTNEYKYTVNTITCSNDRLDRFHQSMRSILTTIPIYKQQSLLNIK